MFEVRMLLRSALQLVVGFLKSFLSLYTSIDPQNVKVKRNS